jgi:hypothetical protein
LNYDPDLYFLSSWDYRCDLPCPARIFLLSVQPYKILNLPGTAGTIVTEYSKVILPFCQARCLRVLWNGVKTAHSTYMGPTARLRLLSSALVTRSKEYYEKEKKHSASPWMSMDFRKNHCMQGRQANTYSK